LKDPEDSFDRALQYAFLLLKYRDRSEKEMLQRLGRKGFSEENARAVADYLKIKGYIDDERFAASLKRTAVEQRLLGRQGVVQYLLTKGIAAGLAKETAGDEADYIETATDLIQRKMRQLSGLDEQTIKRRLWATLARKGYSPEVIRKAMKGYYEIEEETSF
jgi:regulatory protein